MFFGYVMRIALAQVGIAIMVALATTPSSAAVAGSEHNGILELSGGIRSQTAISHATCSAGPGNSIAISLVRVGGWSSLYLTASAPAHDQHGVAKVSVQGTGYRDNSYAIAVWSWAKASSTRSGAQVRIAGNGTTGTIDVKVPLAAVDDASSMPAVLVALNWTAGTCGHSQTR